MIGFYVKKAFWDGWDNVLTLAVFNLGHVLVGSVAFFLPSILGARPFVVMLCIGGGILGLSVWQAAAAFTMRKIADFGTPSLRESLDSFAMAWKPGLALGAALVIILFSIIVGIPFYLSRGGFLGVMLASLLFWTCLVLLLAAQYFLPLVARRGGSLRKNARHALILLADNPGFSFFLLLYHLATILISVLMAFLLPGLAGIALGGADAVRLRLKKYEWLEQNPGADRKNPPWDSLLEEDRALIGKRTLKGMIFPWKDGQ
ncbi:MAG: hypothetical protein RBT73_08720 [Spirochaetia bacterium]|jgi:uncharacterized membrane protein YesL|nr:hypothetical protein [Spirochaetia bacterium]